MSAEITVFLQFAFSKGSSSDGITLSATPTLAGSKYTHGRQAIGVAEEAINLGEATGGGGLFCAVNRDATNDISIRVASAATNFATLKPGEFAIWRWGATATAPFAIASAGTPELEYIVLVA